MRAPVTNETTTEVKITHDLGLHLRAAGALVQVASQFSSHIEIQNGKNIANGKSIMSVLSLAAGCGTELRITATGGDAEEAARAVAEIIHADFNLP